MSVKFFLRHCGPRFSFGCWSLRSVQEADTETYRPAPAAWQAGPLKACRGGGGQGCLQQSGTALVEERVAQHVILCPHTLCVALWRPAGASVTRPHLLLLAVLLPLAATPARRQPRTPARWVCCDLSQIMHSVLVGCTACAGAPVWLLHSMGGDHPNGSSGRHPGGVCGCGAPATRVRDC